MGTYKWLCLVGLVVDKDRRATYEHEDQLNPLHDVVNICDIVSMRSCKNVQLYEQNEEVAQKIADINDDSCEKGASERGVLWMRVLSNEVDEVDHECEHIQGHDRDVVHVVEQYHLIKYNKYGTGFEPRLAHLT